MHVAFLQVGTGKSSSVTELPALPAAKEPLVRTPVHSLMVGPEEALVSLVLQPEPSD